MIVAALSVGAAVSALLAVFPYLIYPATLRRFRQRPVRPRPQQPPPSATLVFCAYNEAASSAAKLDNLRAIRAVCPAMRFQCFVDKSSDDTLALLRAHPDLLSVIEAPARIGKASGMARMMARCDTDIVIFTDANVLLDPASVAPLLAYFSDPEIGGVCGTLHYTNPDDSKAATTSSAYWRLEEKIKRLESLSGSTMGADGSIFATRRALYPQVPAHLLDDMLVSMNVVFMGYRLVTAPDVHAYESAVTGSAAEFRRRRRIACRAYMSHAFIRTHVRALGRLDRYKYFGHKVLRWYGVWLGLMAAVLGLAALTLAFGPSIWLLLLTIGLLGALAVGGRRALLAIEAGGQFLATGLGMTDAWRDRRYQTWSTPGERSPVALQGAAAAGG
jgi:cellulose synthase/poly-beta-1,6-N-acetylglucosamine synthase-like glycosyltransferase